CRPLLYSHSSVDLGLDFSEGKPIDEYAIFRTRSLAAATALAGGVVGFDDFLDRALPLIFEQGDGFVGAGVHAVGAPVAAGIDDMRYGAFQLNTVPGEDGGGSGGCRLRLENGFLDALGRMRQTAQEDAVGHEVDGAQFHMGFEEKAIAI